jgi:hypothetical protein
MEDAHDFQLRAVRFSLSLIGENLDVAPREFLRVLKFGGAGGPLLGGIRPRSSRE